MSNKTRFLSDSALQQQLPVFFQPWWLDIVSGNWDIALAGPDGATTGVWPYSIDRKLGLTLIRNPLLTPYQGPYFLAAADKTSEAGLLNALWQQLPRYDSFDLETVTGFGHADAFTAKGFGATEKITYEIALQQTEEQLYAALNSNHRNLIRQAAACHTITAGTAYAPQLAQLHEETFRRKKKPYPFSAALLAQLIHAAYQQQQGMVLAAKDEKDVVTAAIFTVWDRQKMYLLLSAAHMDTVHPGAVRLLIWEAIKKAKQLGLQQFDFEGSMDPGIGAFFRRFGGERKTYLCLTHHRSALWKLKKALLG